ncbi:MAG: hypothetical protein AAB590_00100, partial [Patescibacteria group bacterium]
MDEEKISNQELIEKLKYPEKSVGKNKTVLLFGIVIILMAILLLANYLTRVYGYYTISEQAIHWHAHLIIRDKGEYVPIPPSVGLLGDTAHPENLLTHSDDS